MPLTIRPALVTEADALTTLTMRSKQSNGYDDAFMAMCVDELRVTPKKITDNTVLLAESEDTLCGTVCLTPDGTIQSFFIAPDHKRQGIGHQLWQAILAHAKQQNQTELRLDADPEAVPFYETLGFITQFETPSGSIPGRTLPHMTLQL